jgi:hypothetical protein
MLGIDDLPCDFFTLPIVVAGNVEKRKDQVVEIANPGSNTDESAVFTDTFTDAIADAAEDMWSRFSTVVKSKVRQVAIEILRSTDAPTSTAQNTHLSFEYDDDARFLD